MNVIVVGDPYSGKSNLIERYFKNTFTDKYTVTINDEYYNKFIYIDDKRYLFRLWDRTGNEQFYSDSQNIIFKGCHCLFLVYDISSKESLEHRTYTCFYWKIQETLSKRSFNSSSRK